MKKIALPLIVSLLTFSAAQAADYKLDPTHTKAVFYIDHFNVSTNSGWFSEINGSIAFDPASRKAAMTVTIPVETMDTGIAAFDKHIKGADILDAAKFPTMVFNSTKWTFSGDKLVSVDGDLTMKGQTRPIQLKATKFGCYQSPIFKAEVCGGDFEASIDRTEWGVDFLVKEGVTKMVTLKIQAEAIKQ
ncbi:YceI family protein [Bosea rubneri]|uniref:YceI family protein n=1 Tax=Bosea rubneri TaxID=3075434 RepID=A0ABU3S6Y2_9HYPH|nr:YceI family protein [Bosea sp. ZW T0_25]MDU0340504.1 YceI family protein [Bosea sp. ZW T0_25]